MKINRRAVLKLSGASAIAATMGGCARSLTVHPSKFAENDPKIFTVEERKLLFAVQDHLLPSEWDSPGAKDVNATAYLELALTGTDIDPTHPEKIKVGIAELRQKGFLELGVDKEAVLRAFESTRIGDKWLQIVMNYTIEAFLGDPAYGGNTDELGWRAVGHSPGVPRPMDLSRIGRR